MKKILYIAVAVFVGLTACQKEEVLTPSGLDQIPLSEQPDLSKELVAKYNNDYGVKIIYNFADSTDFRYTMKDKNSVKSWNLLTIGQLPDTLVDYGLQMLDSLVLKYFKDELEYNNVTITSDFISNYFPRHLFVVDSLAGSYTSLGQYMDELDNYESASYFSFLWNGYEPVFAFDSTIVSKATSTTILKYRNSALYSFLSTLFIDKGAIKEFPTELFEPVKHLYGRSVNTMAVEEEAPTTGYGGRYITAPWYIGKGFALTNTSPRPYRRYGTVTNYTANLDSNYDMYFPGRERDFRNLLHALICESSLSNIRNYYNNEVILGRMKILIEELYGMGIDVFEINPAAREYLNLID